jgi:KDO2-lipid IV(A) lauroyltransferase
MGAPPTRSATKWHPLNWIPWLTVGLLHLIAPLPLRWLLKLGRGIGWFIFYFVPIRRAVTLANLRLCFPEKSEREIQSLALASYKSLGMGVFEALTSNLASDERIIACHSIAGAEHIDAARKAGRGVLLFSAHVHTLEIGARIFALHHDACGFYRPPNNPVFAKVIADGRDKMSKRMFAFDDLKGAVRALRNGEIIWYAPDQGKKFKDTVIAPFFGVPAVTNAATGKIAQLGRALVIPYSIVRTSDRGFYRARIGPPIEGLVDTEPAEQAVMVNRIIEEFVREAPEQYLWQHKRFKRRGDEFPDVYAEE